jgi:hypothetical protein
VILESDNAGVVEAIQKQNQDLSRNWKIFDDINLLSSDCDCFECRKIRREGNVVAHQLAALARNSSESGLCLGSVPTSLVLLVADEYVNTVVNNQ